jgi:two-component system LytT family response regulator
MIEHATARIVVDSTQSDSTRSDSTRSTEGISPSLLAVLTDLHRRLGEALAQIAEDVPLPISRFVVHVGHRALFLKTADVDWCEAAGNYVNLHVGAESYRLRLTLGGLADRLESRQFVRIHKSTVVNLDRIREVQPWFGGDHIAILHDGRKLRVSRTYAAALLKNW